MDEKKCYEFESNNIAKENNVSAQSILQTYMLERLLERISVSKYKNNFILKGGMLISAMLGIDSRTTMDMDTMPVIMTIDITTGDIITYKEIKYSFDLMLEDRKIEIWLYNKDNFYARDIEYENLIESLKKIEKLIAN